MSNEIKLSALAGGAVDERFNLELQKVLDNIRDLNTEAKKKRKITLEIVIEPNEQRDLGVVAVTAKTTLAPALDIGTTLIIDSDQSNVVRASELKSGIRGQTFISDDGEILDDRGKPVIEGPAEEENANGNVVRFKG